MKGLSLIAGTVILTVYAVSAAAQLDANATVRLYCGSVGGSCSMVVHCTDGDQQASAGCSVGFDSTFRLGDRGRGSLPTFEIDSINDQIRNLRLSNFQNNPNTVGGLPIGASFVHIVFHPILFVRSGGTVKILSSSYPAAYDAGGFLRYGIHNYCTGSCSDSGLIMDSVFLEIQPAKMKVNGTLQLPQSLRILSNRESHICMFAASPNKRVLEVSNTIGVVMIRTVIDCGETFKEIPLPIGCYFARLGNEVAKFVVTE